MCLVSCAPNSFMQASGTKPNSLGWATNFLSKKSRQNPALSSVLESLRYNVPSALYSIAPCKSQRCLTHMPPRTIW